MNKNILIFLLAVCFVFSCDDVNQDQDPSDFQPLDSAGMDVSTKNALPVKSLLTIMNVNKGTSFVAFESEMFFEAPNYTRDGRFIIFNSNGKLYKLQLYSDGLPEEIPTGFAQNCNNDHIVSPDGKSIGFSNQEKEKNISKIYVMPYLGGTPKLVTSKGPSYLHGWSPDAKKMIYCSERRGDFDIYSIEITGKKETRLTNTKGLDDGPEYTPDGKQIYFNSERTGLMQIWKMDVDGKNQTQVTFDEYNNWFPHISPDGKKVAFLSYDKSIKGHQANKYVQIRLLDLATGKIKVLQKILGGQGSINVNSWSPDSKSISFIVYEPLKSTY